MPDITPSDDTILDQSTIRALSRVQFARWALAAIVDWSVVVATFVVVARIDHPAIYVLSIVPLGSRQQALGALFHDAAHHLASRSRRVNDVAGSFLAAWPLGLTLGGYRRYHFAHHRHLGTPADPEMAHKSALRQWHLPLSRVKIAAYFLGDLGGGGVPHLIAAGKLTRPVAIVETFGIAIFWAAIFLAAWHVNLVWIPALWIASIATIFWSGVRLRIWTEHLGTLGTHRVDVPSWLEHFIMPHNIGFHWEHHTWPSVPFYNLGKLRASVSHARRPLLKDAPIVSLAVLFRSFQHSEVLRSGALGVTIGDDGRPIVR